VGGGVLGEDGEQLLGDDQAHFDFLLLEAVDDGREVEAEQALGEGDGKDGVG
jgi:hypothetical protein